MHTSFNQPSRWMMIIAGDAGPKGDAGPQGIQGDVGPQGPQGPKGDAGIQGIQGPQGAKGDTGSTGPSGATGNAGATGSQGPKGDTGPAGPSNTTAVSGTITRAASAASGTQSIALAFQPAYVLFSFVDDSDSSVTSDGWDDGTVAASTYTSSQNVLTNLVGGVLAAAITNKSHANSVSLIGGGSGHTAKITAKSSGGFTLTWARVGSGRTITGKYIAVY